MMMRYATSKSFALAALCVLLAFSAACSDVSEPPAARVRAELTVPTPVLNQYVILAARAATIGDRTSVTGGDLGVAASSTATPNTLTGGLDARIGVGEVLLAQRVVLRERAVAGEIGANVIEATGATTGPRSAFVAPPPRPVPGAITAGTTAITVNTGQTTTLAPGRFGAVTVSGTLNLSGGLYEIQSLRLNPDARLVALTSAVVRVTGGVSALDRSQLAPAAALAAGALRLIVAGTVDTANTSVVFGTDSQFRALVVAQGIFRSGERLRASGAISAQDVIIGNEATLAFNTGFACTSNAGCNDNNACTTDTCVDAQCRNTPVANGTTCSDGNSCTRTDSCQAGVCTGTNPVVCTASDQCHAAGTCNPANGVCSNPARPNGTACNDGNACTQVDACQVGSCVGASPVVCTASDQCHVAGTCNPSTGICANPLAADGTTCDDANRCTQADSCRAGACAGAPVQCVAQDSCHDPGICDLSTGLCSNPVRADGSACSDGNACTRLDVCQAGTCSGSDPVTCVALDQCHDVGICNPASGACSNPPTTDGSSCNDNDACTFGDRCVAGICSAGTDFAVTEFSTGVARPTAIASGPLASLWFVSAETSLGATDGSVGRITASGAVTRIAANRDLHSVIQGPDGMLWVSERLVGLPALGRFDTATELVVSDFIGIQAHDLAVTNDAAGPVVWFTGNSSVGRITPTGTALTAVPTLNATRAITVGRGSPSTVWFTEANNGRGAALIGRVVYPNLTQYPIPTSGELADITEGPDGGIWFTDVARNEIGRMVPSGGATTKFPLSTASSTPYGITGAPDGNVWFTMRSANKIGRITPSGEVTEFCIPTEASDPTQITVGPDGNLWFMELNSGNVARLTLTMSSSPSP